VALADPSGTPRVHDRDRCELAAVAPPVIATAVSWWSSNGSIGNRELTTVAIMVASTALTSRLSRSWTQRRPRLPPLTRKIATAVS